MARPKRPPHPLIKVARNYLIQHEPELRDAPIVLHQLDGPPGSPRYAALATACFPGGPCPYHVDPGEPCPIHDCEKRATVRLLFSRDGALVKVSRSTIRWEGHPSSAEETYD